MKKIYFMLVLALFLVSGCGAKTDYYLDFEMDTKKILLNVDVRVDRKDYEYIEGGADELKSIIEKNIPNFLDYNMIKEEKYDLYNFKATFDTYDHFMETYKNQTKEAIPNAVNFSEYSSTSPFLSVYEVSFGGNLDGFMNWLVNAIKASGKVKDGKATSLIEQSTSSYRISGDENYTRSLKVVANEKQVIKNTVISIFFEEPDKMNFNISFETDNEYENFRDYFVEYVSYHKIPNVRVSNDSEGKYTLKFEEVDLIVGFEQINKILGDGFIAFTNLSISEDTFFNSEIVQTTNMSINSKSLFNLNEILEFDINVNGKNIENIDSDLNIINRSASVIQFESKNIFKEFKLMNIGLLIAILIIFAILVIILIRKYKNNSEFYKSKFSSLTESSKKGLEAATVHSSQQLNGLKAFINKDINPDILIRKNCIEGENHVISISNITKVSLLKKINMLNEIMRIILIAILMVIMLIAKLYLLLIIITVAVVFLVWKITIDKDTKVIAVMSSSGGTELYSFDSNVATAKFVEIKEKIKGEIKSYED